jgi:hypothetical protein
LPRGFVSVTDCGVPDGVGWLWDTVTSESVRPDVPSRIREMSYEKQKQASEISSKNDFKLTIPKTTSFISEV